MLNSFLSHLLFGSNTTTNNDQQQQQEDTQSAINNNFNNTTTTNIVIDNEKYTDVRNDVDWVIIDPSDNDEVKKHLKRKLNSMSKSMQVSEYGLKNLFDSQYNNNNNNNTSGMHSDGASDDSMMDRSLSFDESRPMTPFNNNNNNNKEAVVVIVNNKDEEQQPKQQQQDSWLVTPLPSLVKMNSKSMNEETSIENLLIEHPSMSVFITQDEIDEATNETAADTSFALINNKDEVVISAENSNNSTTTTSKKPSTRKNKAKKSKKNSQQQQTKENEASSSTTPSVVSSSSRHHQVLCNKQTSNNKLITTTSQINKDQRCNFTKLQEKCKNFVKNVNLKQRKYHNLQQPQYVNFKFVNIRH